MDEKEVLIEVSLLPTITPGASSRARICRREDLADPRVPKPLPMGLASYMCTYQIARR